ncbi:acetamidase [Penicillium angulare]|uniref:acetamidase n=1 Tax=Penicillium angulare TaxID=116970 RepID=UPI002540F8F6|nr:acetamidase [Penicillium angulare]KAJ5291106.1 acetamidase [Penicillium angulare]
MYFVGDLTNNPRHAADNAGVLRGIMSAGEAVTFAINSRGTSFVVKAGAIGDFYATSVICMGYMALFIIEETNYFAKNEEEVTLPKHIKFASERGTKIEACDEAHLEQSCGKNAKLEEVDAIIAPVAATAASRHNQFRYHGYSSVINLLDLTSVAVPVEAPNMHIDVKKDTYGPLDQLDPDVQAEYDPEAYHGAPIAVQIIGRRLTEEKTLTLA